ncbi:ABC transporter substrate-binding protein [Luteococcus sediminum]
MTVHTLRRRAALAVATLAALGACSLPTPATPPAAPSSSGASAQGLTLADPFGTDSYNPVAGHGELGVSPIYDGLLALDPTKPDELPGFTPALASAMPRHNAELTQWTVALRPGVRFHDGTDFDASDVVATYRAVLDPRSGSEIASAFEMIDEVTSAAKDGREEVTFHLKYPYADFPARLLLAIAPSQKLTPGPVTESSLNQQPVGTGPYRLTSLTPERAELTAFADHWRGTPQVGSITTVRLSDDSARVLRTRNGEFDGTVVPPALAGSFSGAAGLQVVQAHTADWRGVSLPADSPLTRDATVRRALNLAVDRQAMVDTLLAGHGRPAHTPVSPVHGEAHDPTATFDHDPEAAQRLLDEAGWTMGPDGIRTKDGQPAAFPLAYDPTDSLRRDLATAFTADMKKVGVHVRLEALGWDKIEPRLSSLGILLGGGDKPYSIDTQLFAALHSPVPGTSIYDNPSRVSTPAIDAALDRARRTADTKTRNGLYRTVQQEYLDDPAYIMLVFADHTYVMREDDWKHGPLTIEPHTHGVGWGPWWRVGSWTR